MSSRIVARAAWIVPISLLWLAGHQGWSAIGLGRTLASGEDAFAEVTRYERSDRKDVTHAELDLRVELADGSVIERERLALPYSVAHRVETDTVRVRVLRGASQEVVLVDIAETQRRIAWSNMAMSLVMGLIALAGVLAWNRYLTRTPGPDGFGSGAEE